MPEELELECDFAIGDKLKVSVTTEGIHLLSENYINKEILKDSASIVLNKQSALDLACFLLKGAENLAD